MSGLLLHVLSFLLTLCFVQLILKIFEAHAFNCQCSYKLLATVFVMVLRVQSMVGWLVLFLGV